MDGPYPLRPTSIRDLELLIGTDLQPTEWQHIRQVEIDAFSELTGDRQWIHVDPVRAAEGPFGSTIAHGLYVLSLGPALLEKLIAFDGFGHVLNYGYDKIRFPAPTPVDCRIRMIAQVSSVESKAPGRAQVSITQTFEVEGSAKPNCVATAIGQFMERQADSTS
jgi:acyl dehydratase